MKAVDVGAGGTERTGGAHVTTWQETTRESVHEACDCANAPFRNEESDLSTSSNFATVDIGILNTALTVSDRGRLAVHAGLCRKKHGHHAIPCTVYCFCPGIVRDPPILQVGAFSCRKSGMIQVPRQLCKGSLFARTAASSRDVMPHFPSPCFRAGLHHKAHNPSTINSDAHPSSSRTLPRTHLQPDIPLFPFLICPHTSDTRTHSRARTLHSRRPLHMQVHRRRPRH